MDQSTDEVSTPEHDNGAAAIEGWVATRRPLLSALLILGILIAALVVISVVRGS